MAVGHPHAASQGGIARNRTVLAHQRAPEERHQLFAPRSRIGRPEALVNGLIFDAGLGIERRPQHLEVQAAEHFLDTRTVERDEHHVVISRLSCRPHGGCNGQHEDNGEASHCVQHVVTREPSRHVANP